jgi:hypothetical protein
VGEEYVACLSSKDHIVMDIYKQWAETREKTDEKKHRQEKNTN